MCTLSKTWGVEEGEREREGERGRERERAREREREKGVRDEKITHRTDQGDLCSNTLIMVKENIVQQQGDTFSTVYK